MVIIDEGNTKLVNPVQTLKAPLLMVVTVDGMTTVVSLAQPKKVLVAIETMP